MIQSLSDPSSIPEDFVDVLEKYTHDGLRVLALAYRDYERFGKKQLICVPNIQIYKFVEFC
jgi:magnesium-transporting ATPase (P-type)